MSIANLESRLNALLTEYEGQFGSLATRKDGVAQFAQALEATGLVSAGGANSLYALYAANFDAGDPSLRTKFVDNAANAMRQWLMSNPAWQQPGTAIEPVATHANAPWQTVASATGPGGYGNAADLATALVAPDLAQSLRGIEQDAATARQSLHPMADQTTKLWDMLQRYGEVYGDAVATKATAARFLQDFEALNLITAAQASAIYDQYQVDRIRNPLATAAYLTTRTSQAIADNFAAPVYQQPGALLERLVDRAQPTVPPPPPPPPPVTVPPPPPPPPTTGSGGGGTTTPPQQTTLLDLATSFITSLYTTILGRAPDTDGLAYQRDQFIAAATANGIAAAEKQFVQQFANSGEGVAYSNSIWASAQVPPPPPPPPSADPIGVLATQFVSDLYTTILGRPADAGGLATQVAAFRSYAQAGGISAAESNIASQIAHSTEATQRNWVDGASFLTSLYTDLLGRAPDAGGLQVQLDAFNAEVGSSGIAAAEADFAAAFANSGEGLANSAAVQAAANAATSPPPPPPTVSTQALVPYATSYIRSLYSSILGRSQATIDGDAAGVAVQANAFASYARDFGVRAAQVQFATVLADTGEAKARDKLSPLPVESPSDALAYITGLYQAVTGGSTPAEQVLTSAVDDYLSYEQQHGQTAARRTFQSRVYSSYEAVSYRSQSPSRYTVLDAKVFLTGLYYSELGRAPDADGGPSQLKAYIAYANVFGIAAAQTDFRTFFHDSAEAVQARAAYGGNLPTPHFDELEGGEGGTTTGLGSGGGALDGGSPSNDGTIATNAATPTTTATAPTGSHIPGLSAYLAGAPGMETVPPRPFTNQGSSNQAAYMASLIANLALVASSFIDEGDDAVTIGGFVFTSGRGDSLPVGVAPNSVYHDNSDGTFTRVGSIDDAGNTTLFSGTSGVTTPPSEGTDAPPTQQNGVLKLTNPEDVQSYREMVALGGGDPFLIKDDGTFDMDRALSNSGVAAATLAILAMGLIAPGPTSAGVVGFTGAYFGALSAGLTQEQALRAGFAGAFAGAFTAATGLGAGLLGVGAFMGGATDAVTQYVDSGKIDPKEVLVATIGGMLGVQGSVVKEILGFAGIQVEAAAATLDWLGTYASSLASSGIGRLADQFRASQTPTSPPPPPPPPPPAGDPNGSNGSNP